MPSGARSADRAPSAACIEDRRRHLARADHAGADAVDAFLMLMVWLIATTPCLAANRRGRTAGWRCGRPSRRCGSARRPAACASSAAPPSYNRRRSTGAVDHLLGAGRRELGPAALEDVEARVVDQDVAAAVLASISWAIAVTASAFIRSPGLMSTLPPAFVMVAAVSPAAPCAGRSAPPSRPPWPARPPPPARPRARTGHQATLARQRSH